jgi:hypothetical protein
MKIEINNQNYVVLSFLNKNGGILVEYYNHNDAIYQRRIIDGVDFIDLLDIFSYSKDYDKKIFELWTPTEKWGEIIERECIRLLNDFCVNEYGDFLDNDNLKDLTKIPIMYTDYEKGYDEEVTEDIKVQVYADIKNYKIIIEYNDIQVYEENYDEKEFLKLLESLDFDSYINLDEIDIYKEKLEKIRKGDDFLK